MQRHGAASDVSRIRYESVGSKPPGHNRPRRVTRWVAAITLATNLVGCTDKASETGMSDACEDLVGVGIEAVIEARDNAGELARLDFDRATPESSEVIDTYFEAVDDIQRRSQAFGCDNAALSEAFKSRLNELQVRSVGGALILLEAYAYLNPFEGIE